MKRLLPAIMILTALSLIPACGGKKEGADNATATAFKGVTEAVCVLSPTATEVEEGKGNSVSGTITFRQTPKGLLVEWDVSGLKPGAKHGFHVHEFGDVSDAKAGKATGGHYNPEGNKEHSLPEDHDDHGHSITGGHAGDLGNLEADEDGNAKGSKTFANITLTAKNAIIGRGLIVHRDNDKGKDEQPTGGAGPRIAQGVIGIAKGKTEK